MAKDKTLAAIAEKYGKSPQQVLLVWGLQNGFSVIPKSVTESRIKANFDIDGLVLKDEDFEALSNLPDRFKVCGDTWLPEGQKMHFYDVDSKKYKLDNIRD